MPLSLEYAINFHAPLPSHILPCMRRLTVSFSNRALAVRFVSPCQDACCTDPDHAHTSAPTRVMSSHARELIASHASDMRSHAHDAHSRAEMPLLLEHAIDFQVPLPSHTLPMHTDRQLLQPCPCSQVRIPLSRRMLHCPR